MSRAATVFSEAITDAEILLAHFDKLNSKPPPPEAEVFKRAGLIMALTAWETYVEDRVDEALQERLKVIVGSPVAKFVSEKFQEEVTRLNNPNSAKTQKLFADYLSLDITKHWTWSGMDVPATKKYLDNLLAKRGDAAHRSRPSAGSVSNGHLVKREELEKGIAFLKCLVEKSEEALDAL